MKRVLVAAMMLLVTGSVFATDGKIEREQGKQEVNKEVKPSGSLEVNDKSCTVTISGTLRYLFVADATYSCSATATTCQEASDDAQACVAYNIEKFYQKVKNVWNKILSYLD